MKTKTNVNAGGLDLNHNQTVVLLANLRETLVRDSGGLKVKTRLKAGLKMP